MANVVLEKGNRGPVNQGERNVLNLLKDRLPDDFELFPNLEIAVGQGSLKECDIIVLGPDCIWLVEVKDIAGTVEVGERVFRVNSESRTHPVTSTKKKAQQIKSRVSSDPQLTGVWIQPIVIFARSPRSLQVTQVMEDFVFVFDEAIAVLTDPTLIGLQRNRLPLNLRNRFKAQLHLNAEARRDRPVFGGYKCLRLLSEGGGHQWWEASHSLIGNRVFLQVISIDPLLSVPQQEQLHDQAIRAARVRGHVGASEFLLLPENALLTDDGSVVVVHPATALPTLEDLQDDLVSWSEGEKRRVVWSISNALDVLHSKGVAHRTVGPNSIFVGESGDAKLGGMSSAGFESRQNQTFSPDDWGNLGGNFFISPEHASGQVTAKSDLFALGRLFQFLWPSGVPPELKEVSNFALASSPSDRKTTPRAIAQLCAPKQTPPLRVQNPLKEETVLDRRYLLVNQIGKGASSEVWRAEDLQTHSSVALKVFLSTDAGDRARREFLALQDRFHPGIVRVHHFGKIDGYWVLISDFLEGPNLRLAMPPVAPVLSDEQAVSMGIQLLSALQSMHPKMPRIVELSGATIRTEDQERELDELRQSGIAHRDIKPENIILVDGSQPVLVDFGLAGSGSSGMEGGTREYRPAGVALDSTDPDVDLFAVGVILHELLSGVHPYLNSDPELGKLHIDSSLSPKIQKILSRACSNRFGERFHSAEAFIEALVELGLEIVPLPVPPLDHAQLYWKIQKATIAGQWDDALQLCPDGWGPIKDQIIRRKELAEEAAASAVLLQQDGFELRYVRTEGFESAHSVDGESVGPGQVHVFRANGPSGELVDFGYFISDCGSRWVGAIDVYETPHPLKRLGQGLRLGIREHGEQLVADLAQAQIKNDELWSNCYKADRSQLDFGAGVDTDALFQTHGATSFGTKEEILGDSSNRRKYLCATFPQDSVDLPAILYFATRIMPLARGVRNQ